MNRLHSLRAPEPTAFGLSRRYGSVVDHLYGVEVVVVGRDGAPRVVEATQEPGDPNSDLWWAHTGSGGRSRIGDM